MKMKKMLIIFLLLFVYSCLNAGDLIVEAGSSWSYFRTEGGTSHPKPAYGFGLQFYPVSKFNGFWSVGLKYLRKKMVLENISWSTNLHNLNDSNISLGNIVTDYSYYEIPLGIGYQIIRKSGWISIVFIEGSISSPLNNYSKAENKKYIILKPEEKGHHKFDYLLVDDPVVNPSKNLTLGFQIFYRSLGIQLVYIRALETTESMYGLTIKDYIDAFRIQLCYRFKNFT
ncbi:MAG: hypothetical protein ACT6FF_05270 [Methanosarcinaceae archaeon]